jgi:3-oxoacyl-[acyl-carrier-protein] synthase III
MAMTNGTRPTVKLIGRDGNAFAVMGACRRALKDAGANTEEIDRFMAEATSGDYDNVLRTAMEWCDVE